LRRVVNLMTVLLKVPHEISGTQAASARLMLLVWLRGSRSCGCLHPDIVMRWYIQETTKTS
jgi:hypothetical protein